MKTVSSSFKYAMSGTSTTGSKPFFTGKVPQGDSSDAVFMH
ncbi:hypothetical protein CVCC1112_2916 [Paenarthrobacter nicotinovorans]|nr:hypothetical protein CVCC1112_2916 [Paenarthrobacter nicotinovorans]